MSRDDRQPYEQRFRPLQRRFVATVIAGFALVLIVMIAAGVIGLRAMGRIDEEARTVSGRYLRETQLIDRMAQQQASLSVLIYSLAGEQTNLEPRPLQTRLAAERDQTLAVVNEAVLRENVDAAERQAWLAVREAATTFFAEAERLALQRRLYSPALSSHFQRLTSATNRLMDAAYDDAARTRNAQLAMDAGELQAARKLFLLSLALAGICAVISGGLAVVWFHSLKRHAATLAELSMHTLAEHEENARRFSQEMHDEFGQMLNAIESNLIVIKPGNADSAERLGESVTLVKEAQSTARELSQLLRPRILDDFGLDAGLRELARGFSQRTGIVVEYRSDVRERMAPVLETHLFRIAQEALTNTARHSVASAVNILLEKAGDLLVLAIKDDGQGFAADGPPASGLGFLGMKERARAISGRLEILSRPGEGVGIRVSVPLSRLRWTKEEG